MRHPKQKPEVNYCFAKLSTMKRVYIQVVCTYCQVTYDGQRLCAFTTGSDCWFGSSDVGFEVSLSSQLLTTHICVKGWNLFLYIADQSLVVTFRWHCKRPKFKIDVSYCCDILEGLLGYLLRYRNPVECFMFNQTTPDSGRFRRRGDGIETCPPPLPKDTQYSGMSYIFEKNINNTVIVVIRLKIHSYSILGSGTNSTPSSTNNN